MFSDQIHSAEAAEAVLKQQVAIQERLAKGREGQARQRFEAQFNKLITALREFSDEYNRAPGRVWPAKQAAALKKAMRDLELPASGETADIALATRH
jgi:hypothetical protein